jgi:hypothetical protein
VAGTDACAAGNQVSDVGSCRLQARSALRRDVHLCCLAALNDVQTATCEPFLRDQSGDPPQVF